MDCLSLAAILQPKAPTSCPAQNGNWGEVSAKSISGPGAPSPLSLSDCHPTIENDYSLIHIDDVSSSPFQADGGIGFDGFVFGITPVLQFSITHWIQSLRCT
ncbi:uncharacterized protein A1O5_10094 [Cladophialophora psammophila CBS 110553]|uniref:Uncharacterized protein n=1 Tax=Cladophialophora psammophila CBS 110553 TaxID=1182543 RepID=W9X8Y8_9EURO|nr:uncharacterized protein A1O5_10094 [Cladophialophora psammophila CBS 110553]EXJ66899.1 hypothetical protein A1O5_10094 [Cladophialophora psammophila CBS 110553]